MLDSNPDDTHLVNRVWSSFALQEPLAHYYKANGHTTEARVKAAEENWGPNKFVVPLPEFLAMLKEQLLAPFFVFQVFCVGLWCLDEYW